MSNKEIERAIQDVDDIYLEVNGRYMTEGEKAIIRLELMRPSFVTNQRGNWERTVELSILIIGLVGLGFLAVGFII